MIKETNSFIRRNICYKKRKENYFPPQKNAFPGRKLFLPIDIAFLRQYKIIISPNNESFYQADFPPAPECNFN